ncbi:PEP-CTERM sorting domain-containing protein [Janthinobacterium sp. FT14W]|uniref:NF038122 family metalloprotease n=1 Tax=Janthinobacterium sp. FT14W TaxID=2654253 RepID=UPI0012649476|nr:NF038122 family metalloprotease [Janthinobacterium sp. FT14W]KAB8057310.1 PEP-CTERM sorting domain-containing protein [Janthinobacterium sp. FT14W]
MKACFAALALALPASTLASPLFNLHYVPGTSLQAQQGFQAAAARWSRVLKDNVTVELTVGFNSLGGNILGQTGSSEAFYRYSDFRSALAADATSSIDQRALAHLPAGDSFGMLINRTANNPNGPGSAVPYVDNNGDANNQYLSLSNAEAKAIGLTPPPQSLDGCIGNCDGFIQFNSDFNFDFDPGNGIGANSIDFIGVAMHEIGHALGFLSGVDILDLNSPPLGGPYDDSEFTYVSGLDLFRYSADSAAAGVIDWTADNRDKYFSLDGGATRGPLFANGAYHGDGDQASHWRDNMGLGIMDPTVAYGELLRLRWNDLMALDAIGWDIDPAAIPAPSSASLLCLALMLLALQQKR